MAKKDNNLRACTEHALAQVEEAIPTIGYMPPSKRPSRKHIIIVSETAPTEVKQNVERLAFADPIGFLSALLHGNPVATHVIQADGSVKTEWHNATLEHRAVIARYFADKLVPYMTRLRAADIKPDKGDGDEAMFQRAADKHGPA
jgi:hypothetical protein